MGRGTPKSSSKIERMVFSFESVKILNSYDRCGRTSTGTAGAYESGCGTLHGRDAVAAAAPNRGREACRESA